jgi:hypothetical protein
MGHSDSPMSVSLRLVVLRLGDTSVRAIVRSLRQLRATTAGRETSGQGPPVPRLVAGDTCVSQVAWPPLCARPALRTPVDETSLAINGGSHVACQTFKAVGTHDEHFRGSITRLSHLLSTLRSRGHPRTTQD